MFLVPGRVEAWRFPRRDDRSALFSVNSVKPGVLPDRRRMSPLMIGPSFHLVLLRRASPPRFVVLDLGSLARPVPLSKGVRALFVTDQSP